MCAVWVCIPSARPVEEVRLWGKAWSERGYKVAIWRDQLDDVYHVANYFIGEIEGKYPGYAVATNRLIDAVLTSDPHCDWVVAGGDDVFPDANRTAQEIAAQCSEHFIVENAARGEDGDWFQRCMTGEQAETFGVMQPTGHRWGSEEPWAKAMFPGQEAYIDRIAGSPWIGREFALRINGGKGPFWPEYRHCWSDEELMNVATKLGIFWQRRDLIHFHNHWMLEGKKEPAHLVEANKTYQRDKPLFERRKAAGWPGHEVIV